MLSEHKQLDPVCLFKTHKHTSANLFKQLKKSSQNSTNAESHTILLRI